MIRFVRKVSAYLIFVLCVVLIPAYAIDPFNVFHWDHIRNNGIEPNKNYIKTKYIVRNPDLFESFIFGSSRVSAIHPERITGERVYNMTCSRGVPAEHLETLRSMIKAKVNVKTVYIGLDSLSYTEDARSHYGTTLRTSYQDLQDPDTFFTVYMHPKENLYSLMAVRDKRGKVVWRGYDTFYSAGWDLDYEQPSFYDWTAAEVVIGEDDRMEETLEEIREIKELCDSRGIKLVIWTNPMYKLTYDVSLERDYLLFLRRLADVTAYYNFSGLNDITVDADCYFDTSHYRAEIGDMILDTVCCGARYDGLYEQGFGWYVTEENADALIDLLERQLQDGEQPPT